MPNTTVGMSLLVHVCVRAQQYGKREKRNWIESKTEERIQVKVMEPYKVYHLQDFQIEIK